MRADEEYLKDILHACLSIQDFVAGLEKDVFVSIDSLLSAALWKFMIIGEAAARISPELKERHSIIEWKALAGFRNLLVHAYFKVNSDLIWDAIVNRIYPLEREVRHIILVEFPSSGKSDA